MAWNEPGKDKDPWGGRGNDGPPDLDEAFKKLQNKLNGMFGGSSGDNRNGGNGGLGLVIAAIAGVVLLVYVMAGFFQVDAKERAVILQFGAFKEIKTEGLAWSPPLITKVFIVNATRENQYATRGQMLTQDESIVELPISVQYNVSDVKAYVLNVRDPEISLKQATDSALRHVVGSTELDQVLSEGRAKMAAQVKQRLQSYLDNYGSGIQIINVNIQQAQPPEEVRAAFDDVIKAKEDEARLKNEAESYSNQIIPEARGKSQRLIEEAQAYKSEVVSRAEGESDRFESLLTEYKHAPEVTRKRLYLDAMESMMTKSSKVLVDVENNSVLYLPLDKLAKAVPPPSDDASAQSAVAPAARDIEVTSKNFITSGATLMSGKSLFSLAVALLVLVVASSSVFIVNQYERAVVLRFGKLVEADVQPGLHFKVPLTDKVRRFDGRLLTADMSTESFFTIENKRLMVDSYIKWRIKDVETYYKATGGDERLAADRLTQRVADGLRNQFGRRTLHEVVSGQRDELMAELTKSLNEGANSLLGIEVVDIRVKRIDFPTEVSQSVFARMAADREKEAREYRAQGKEQSEVIRADAERQRTVLEANAYRDAERIRGEGDAKASAIYAAAYTKDPEFYSFLRSLNVYRKSFNSKDDLMVVDPKGDFFRYLKDAQGKK